MKRIGDDWLGSAMLLWAGAALLALYLLCNPMASTLREPLDSTRLWGAVLGLVFLGIALSAHGLFPWLLFLATLPLLLLPTPLNRCLARVSFLSVSALGVFLHLGRYLGRKRGGLWGKRMRRVVWRKREGTRRSAVIRRPGRHFRLHAGTEQGAAPMSVPPVPAEEEREEGE